MNFRKTFEKYLLHINSKAHVANDSRYTPWKKNITLSFLPIHISITHFFVERISITHLIPLIWIFPLNFVFDLMQCVFSFTYKCIHNKKISILRWIFLQLVVVQTVLSTIKKITIFYYSSTKKISCCLKMFAVVQGTTAKSWFFLHSLKYVWKHKKLNCVLWSFFSKTFFKIRKPFEKTPLEVLKCS